MDKEKKNKKNLLYWAIILLLIIIILLLLFCNKFGKMGKCCSVPTGNIDIFDINFGNVCENGIKNGDIPVWNQDTNKNELGKIYIDDKDGNYIYHQKLNIFENPFYEFEDKIAPGVSNSYSFIVHNESDMNIEYYIEMYDKCDYDLELKYRLKRNGDYIIGNDDKWVGVDELKTAFHDIKGNSNDKYVLDWKWEYEDNRDEIDTYIGENMRDAYTLNIKFYFEQS